MYTCDSECAFNCNLDQALIPDSNTAMISQGLKVDICFPIVKNIYSPTSPPDAMVCELTINLMFKRILKMIHIMVAIKK